MSALTTAFPSEIADDDAAGIVAWAGRTFGSGLVLTASFEDPVLVHLVATHAPGTPIVVLDTQYLFAETKWLIDNLHRRLKFPLEVFHPAADVVPDDQWQFDVEGCCGRRKVEPLARALSGRTGWITGIRRVDGPTRADTPIVQFDEARNITKINPLAAWTDEHVERYIVEHALPRNPLTGEQQHGCASFGGHLANDGDGFVLEFVESFVVVNAVESVVDEGHVDPFRVGD